MDEEKEFGKVAGWEKAIKELSLALKTIGIYPADHPAIKGSVERAYASMVGLLETSPEVRLEIGPKNLMVDGRVLDKANEIFRDFAFQFHRRGVISVTFKRGLSVQELESLLQVASLEPKSLQKSGEFSKICQQKEISHIDVLEIDYQKFFGIAEEVGKEVEVGKVRKDEEIWVDLIRTLEMYSGLKLSEVEQNFLLHLEADPGKMANYLEGAASRSLASTRGVGGVLVRRTLNNIGNYIFRNFPEEKEAHRKKLAEVVSHLDPKLRLQLIDAEIDMEPGEIDVMKEIVPCLPNSMIVEMMTLAVSSEGKVTERLMKLFHKIVPEEERKVEVIPLFAENLADISGKGDSLFMRRLIENLFLPTPTEEFISETYRKTLKELNEQISSISEIKEYVDSFTEKRIEEQAADVVVNLMRLETEPGDYGEIVKYLAKTAMDFLLTGRYEEAKKIIEALVEESSPQRGRANEQRKICNEAMERLRDIGIVRELVAALRDWGREKYETIQFILLQMGEIAAAPLLDALARETDRSLRKKIISIVVGLGEQAIPEIVARLSDENWYVARNMVRILREIGTEKAMRYLDVLLKHEDPRVRKEVLYALSSTGGKEAIRLISLMTGDPDTEVRQNAIKYLGSTRNRGTVPLLLKLVRKRNPFGRNNSLIISGIEALGEIGAEEAVPALIGLLRKSTIFARSRNDELRIAAATALEKIGSKEAMEGLVRGARYKRKIVRQACERLIRRHEESKKKV